MEITRGMLEIITLSIANHKDYVKDELSKDIVKYEAMHLDHLKHIEQVEDWISELVEKRNYWDWTDKFNF